MVGLAERHEDGPVPLEALAHEQQIPERYLAKIIQDLRRSGLIRSVRGAHGGYVLSRPPSKVSLLDIWEGLEGSLCPVDCLDSTAVCARRAECPTRGVWEKLREAIAEVLRSENLGRLARRHEARLGRRSPAEGL